ncbi:MAG: hypothetical protein GFH27_549279n209 [Chloroflexi bacterium AL-W]|nr:hypothetical protein [Chloroflexi bacterium AL-N1]NOK65175.1 hypothetical protein [Chloroflexi bacterium AL-N10]NOK72559.1 hypothetical protein [Chloroflexi bacterium AL-N5]NOK79354.1 hypothetical protein [Chloroflexi bacterium AL-W]NOK87270.1 hypothetical protein [Chloroflexi bacterium AL-N15]
MAFWKRTGRSQEQEGLNAWDRATKSMAVSASRRGFLKKLPALGAGLGLGLAGIQTAFGCTVSFPKERNGCCGSQNEKQSFVKFRRECCDGQGCTRTIIGTECSGNCIV